jgi:thiol-disulfide isomerase/thioredoxin
MKTLLFTSPTCGPCKQIKLDLAANGIGREITPIDVSLQENVDIVSSYGVRSVPTMIVLDDDEEIVKVKVGYSGDLTDILSLLN